MHKKISTKPLPSNQLDIYTEMFLQVSQRITCRQTPSLSLLITKLSRPRVLKALNSRKTPIQIGQPLSSPRHVKMGNSESKPTPGPSHVWQRYYCPSPLVKDYLTHHSCSETPVRFSQELVDSLQASTEVSHLYAYPML